jgi:hypothetical protein
MATIERRADLAAPIAQVWDLLSDIRRLPDLSPRTEAVLDAPTRLTAVGQTFRQVVTAVGRRFESRWTVTHLEDGRRLTIEGSVGFGVRYAITERIAPLDPGRCRLDLTIEYRLPFGPAGRIAARLGVERLAAAEADEVVAGIVAAVAPPAPTDSGSE